MNGSPPAPTATAAPIDPRIRQLYVAAGYYLFPFEAFDLDGRPTTPGFTPPDELKRVLEDAAFAPLWGPIYGRLSVLGQPGSPWRIYSAGVGFSEIGVNLVIGKSLDSFATAGDPWDIAVRWVKNLGTAPLSEVQLLAGRQYNVPRPLLDNLRAALEAIRAILGGGGGGSGGGGGGTPTPAPVTPPDPGQSPPAPGPPGPGPPSRGEDTHATVETDALTPAAAVKIVAGLLEAAGKLTRTRYVNAIVLWHVPERWGTAFPDQAKRYKDLLERPYDFGGNRRIVNAIWDAANGSLWFSRRTDAWGGSPPVRHTPQKLQSFMYPEGFDSQLVEEEDLSCLTAVARAAPG